MSWLACDTARQKMILETELLNEITVTDILPVYNRLAGGLNPQKLPDLAQTPTSPECAGYRSGPAVPGARKTASVGRNRNHPHQAG